MPLIQPLLSQIDDLLYAIIVIFFVDPTLLEVLLNLSQLTPLKNVFVRAYTDEIIVDLVKRHLSQDYELDARSAQQYQTENILMFYRDKICLQSDYQCCVEHIDAQELCKVMIVGPTDTIIQPDAVVVELAHALVADLAVL